MTFQAKGDQIDDGNTDDDAGDNENDHDLRMEDLERRENRIELDGRENPAEKVKAYLDKIALDRRNFDATTLRLADQLATATEYDRVDVFERLLNLLAKSTTIENGVQVLNLGVVGKSHFWTSLHFVALNGNIYILIVIVVCFLMVCDILINLNDLDVKCESGWK